MSFPIEIVEKIRDLLFSRQQAYQHTFNLESKFAEKVLEDLAQFCRANETAFHPDPRMHAVLEGRREVWLRIQNHIQLGSEDLWKLYKRKDIP